MSIEPGTPRRSVEPDAVRRLAGELASLRREVQALGKSANLRNSSISGSDGLAVKDADGNIRLRVSPEDGAILAYNAAGEEVARYGLLAHSDPGEYGIEARDAGGTWIHVGDESVTWANIGGKPATFAPTLPIPGTGVSGAVADATNAGLALEAEGSQYAYDNNVGGTSWFAVYVGNNGGYKFGRNTSSGRYKENVRDFVDTAPALPRLTVFDRKDRLEWPEPVDGVRPEGPPLLVPGRKNETGFIAEEVLEVWPEVVQFFDHGDGNGPVVESVAYEMVGARLVPVVARLLERVEAQDTLISELTARLDALDGGQ